MKQVCGGSARRRTISTSLEGCRTLAITPMPASWFMAEQASQKALKAFLLAEGERSVPIHSVAQLAESCSQIDPDFKEHVAPGRLLDQYYIPTRYPDALPPPAVPFESYTRDQGEKALAAARAIVSLVAEKLTPSDTP